MSECTHKEYKNNEPERLAESACCGSHGNSLSELEHEVENVAPETQIVSKANLDDLKKEILESVGKRVRAPLPFGSVTISAVLGILTLVSLMQVVETASLYNKLKSGDLKTTGSPASAGSQELPSQVGGC